jgi:hypothetical protein
MQCLHSPTPICRYTMANGFYLLLKTPFLSEVQVVDSLPLEEFSALPPFPCMNFTGVCSHREAKALSLLSFCNSDSFRAPSNTLPVLDLDLRQPSTMLKISRFYALAVTATRPFPSQTCYWKFSSTCTHLHGSNNPNSLRDKREQEFNCRASSTHSMRRNSTALYAGISWLKQRNN